MKILWKNSCFQIFYSDGDSSRGLVGCETM